MNYLLLSRILKYVDFFGTNFNFYTEKNRKLYTPLGGILTLFSLIFGIIIFLSMNLEEINHNNPISSTSVVQEEYHNIKFVQEKLWIPWRIRDYEGNLANFSGLLYPIIYYYSGIRNKTDDKLNLEYSFLDYKLCNETSMINNLNYFIIDVSLDQLYCIDMENLNMGGNWDYDFVHYVEFDLYICKNGIDYDENNTDCTTYDTLIEAAQNDNSFEFEIYYPLVHYQPLNKTNPIFVKYNSYFYHLSRFSNKIDRIYLQKHILKDDRGYVIKDEKMSKYWGCETLNGDSYATGYKKDLMTEGSSSRLYSFNIYLNFEVVFYHRYYKKFFLILADGLPITYVVFIFFKFIAKVFKISAGNKKLTELLFENLQEKPSKIKTNKISEIDLIKKKSFYDKKNEKGLLNIKNNNENKFEINKNNNNTSSINNHNNTSELSSINLNQHEQMKNMLKNHNERRNSSIGKNKTHMSNKKVKSNSIFNNSNNNNGNGNSFTNSNSLNLNMADLFNNRGRDLLSQGGNSIYKNDDSGVKKKLQKTKKYYVQKKLFPYKYYLCSIFIKNLEVKKKSCFFTRKFIVVYNFICQLFDISSYLILQKEFQIMKNKIIMGKYKDLLETNQKINVNAHTFNIDMKECLDSNKFSILGRVKEANEDD